MTTHLHQELRAPSKRSRTTDVIRDAINAGQPLPLTVLLESMWRYRDEATRLESLVPGDEDYDPSAARLCRMAAVAVAEKAAPYVHAKLANVAIRPEDEDEASERRTNQRLSNEQLRGKSVTELGRLYLAVAKGEPLDVAEDASTADESSTDAQPVPVEDAT